MAYLTGQQIEDYAFRLAAGLSARQPSGDVRRIIVQEVACIIPRAPQSDRRAVEIATIDLLFGVQKWRSAVSELGLLGVLVGARDG